MASVGDGNILGVRTELGVAHRLLEVEVAQLNALGQVDQQAATIWRRHEKIKNKKSMVDG